MPALGCSRGRADTGALGPVDVPHSSRKRDTTKGHLGLSGAMKCSIFDCRWGFTQVHTFVKGHQIVHVTEYILQYVKDTQ